MPVNKHLKWMEHKDFTKGLWDERGASNLMAPPDALKVCTDFRPLPEGGMRPFYKPTAMGVSGIAGIGTKLCTGIAAFQVPTRGAPTGGGPTGGTESFDAILTTLDTVDFKTRFHRMDQSNGEIVWKLVGTQTNGGPQASFRQTMFEVFTRTDGTKVYLAAVNCASANDGLYTIGYASGVAGTAPDNVLTFLQSWFGPLAISQARILIGGGTDSVVHYSDVGATTFGGSNFVSITPNRSGSGVMIISSIEPDDLLIGKDVGPWVEVNGDISSTATPIREMGIDFHTRRHRQQTCRVPGGIAFMEDGGRMFITDGRTFEDISYPIQRVVSNTANMLGNGGMAYENGLLFVPGGYVYDFKTKCWFKTSVPAGDGRYQWANDGTIFMADSAVGFGVQRLFVMEQGAQYVASANYRTMPLADPEGRSVEVREVQLFIRCNATSTALVKVLDANDNVIGTYTDAALTGYEQVHCFFPNVQDDYVSIDVTLSSNDGVTEAPTLERARYGFGAGNLIK